MVVMAKLNSSKKRLSWIFGLSLMFLCDSVFAEANVRKQMRVRAAFIFQMSKFVNWPMEKSESLVFCLFPDERPYNVNIVLATLEKQGKLISQGYNVQTRLIDINQRDDASHYESCSLVYFNNNSDQQLATSTIKAIGRNRLVIGSNVAFLDRGGMTALVYEKGKHKLYIHRDNYESSLVKIRSRLLSLAKFYPK